MVELVAAFRDTYFQSRHADGRYRIPCRSYAVWAFHESYESRDVGERKDPVVDEDSYARGYRVSHIPSGLMAYKSADRDMAHDVFIALVVHATWWNYAVVDGMKIPPAEAREIVRILKTKDPSCTLTVRE